MSREIKKAYMIFEYTGDYYEPVTEYGHSIFATKELAEKYLIKEGFLKQDTKDDFPYLRKDELGRTCLGIQEYDFVDHDEHPHLLEGDQP